MLDVDLPHVATLYVVVRVARLLGCNVIPRKAESGLGWVCAVGGVFWYAMYHWVSYIVRNRRAPVLGKYTFSMLFLIRPLQTMWRLLTAPLRVTPDVCLTGEVRCGTTTVSAYLNKFPGCHTPFCPWTIGFADDKESFYLVGHFGVMHPLFYRMAFPTIFTKYWNKLLGRPFFTYDACAQYATAPWVAATLANVNPLMKLAFCVREPTSQNISWFHFERSGVKAFEDMGLNGPYAPGREPYHTLREGWAASNSDGVKALYKESERYANAAFIPLKYLTWPRGQTAAYTQMGTYINNIKRFTQYFPKEAIAVVNLSDLKTPEGIEDSLRSLNSLLPVECQVGADRLAEWSSGNAILLNANAARSEQAVDEELVKEMKAYYEPYNRELQEFTGKDLKWS
eukprot:TRINITY_DN949_c0_g3_i1.p1 TRINITY_DN949_c0_g3~~TRINITY_DN949_c0_g3_i1.p1  ORF type:complete len:397 (+),score=59.86 TRINITY_DN949_c0_g3_i1:45-1235(+)